MQRFLIKDSIIYLNGVGLEILSHAKIIQEANRKKCLVLL